MRSLASMSLDCLLMWVSLDCLFTMSLWLQGLWIDSKHRIFAFHVLHWSGLVTWSASMSLICFPTVGLWLQCPWIVSFCWIFGFSVLQLPPYFGFNDIRWSIYLKLFASTSLNGLLTLGLWLHCPGIVFWLQCLSQASLLWISDFYVLHWLPVLASIASYRNSSLFLRASREGRGGVQDPSSTSSLPLILLSFHSSAKSEFSTELWRFPSFKI